MSEDTKTNLLKRLEKVRAAIDSHLEDGGMVEYTTQEESARFERLQDLREQERDIMQRISRIKRGSIRSIVFRY